MWRCSLPGNFDCLTIGLIAEENPDLVGNNFVDRRDASVAHGHLNHTWVITVKSLHIVVAAWNAAFFDWHKFDRDTLGD